MADFVERRATMNQRPSYSPRRGLSDQTALKEIDVDPHRVREEQVSCFLAGSRRISLAALEHSYICESLMNFRRAHH